MNYVYAIQYYISQIGVHRKVCSFSLEGIFMTNNPIPPFSNVELQSQAMNYVNHLSALFTIPLIKTLYNGGCSIDQLHRIRSVFDMLVSSSLYTDAFNLFLCMIEKATYKRPICLYALHHFPILIPCFLLEFLEDFDSLLEDWMH